MKKEFVPGEQPLIEVNGKIIGSKFIETPLEFLERLRLNHEIYLYGLISHIEIQDEFISLSIDGKQQKRVDTYIDVRARLLHEIDLTRTDIENLKLEIEAEKSNPSDEPMASRLKNRLGHL